VVKGVSGEAVIKDVPELGDDGVVSFDQEQFSGTRGRHAVIGGYFGNNLKNKLLLRWRVRHEYAGMRENAILSKNAARINRSPTQSALA
jgi:hypothetical protein